jgi:hypothetical protein
MDSTREWLRAKADDLGVDVDDLLMQSKRRDPLWKGTEADHAKARWFAEWWERAVDGRDGEEIHVRGVHYFVYGHEDDVEPPTNTGWETYENTDACFSYLKNAAMLARVLGYVPLDGILDTEADEWTITTYAGRDHLDPSIHRSDIPSGVRIPSLPAEGARASLSAAFDPGGPSPGDGASDGSKPAGGATLGEATDAYARDAADAIADAVVRSVHIDRDRQEPYHIELWSEKTLPEYVKETAKDAGADAVVEGSGDLSLSVAHRLVKRVEKAERAGIVLYLSDYDPKGTNMAVAMSAKLAWFERRDELDQRIMVNQLAITPDQIEAHDLPRRPISESESTGTGGVSYDTLVNEWERRRGHGATELNALEPRPDVYKQIVREGIEAYTDPDLRRRTDSAMDAWRDEVRERVASELRDADLDEPLRELVAWIQDFNREFEEVRPVLDDLRERREDPDDAYQEWLKTVRDAAEATDVGRPRVPQGDADAPEDPLFDSERDYLENVVRVDAHQNGEK